MTVACDKAFVVLKLLLTSFMLGWRVTPRQEDDISLTAQNTYNTDATQYHRMCLSQFRDQQTMLSYKTRVRTVFQYLLF